MHRLAVLDHDVVGDIDDVVDRADTGRTQALAHPLGTRRDLDVADHTGRVARAQIVRLYVNVQQLAQIALCAALDDRLMVLHRHVERRGGLTRQTDERVAVRAVVGDLEFHDGVVVADDDVHVFADRAALVVQDPDAVGIRLRAVMLGEAQLFV